VSFEKFRAVLKVFRTPGQPFATWPDMQDLHGLCDHGNICTFFKVTTKGGLKSLNYFVSSVLKWIFLKVSFFVTHSLSLFPRF